MLAVYWACLIGGILFSVLTVLFGDVLGGDHDIPGGDGGHFDHGLDILKPAVIVSAITVFGGAGILLASYSGLPSGMAAGVAVSLGVVVATGIYFLYIRPMRNSETSMGYSMNDLVGLVGEVLTSIPAAGYGEVMLKVGAANICQIAASSDNVAIASGTRIVVVHADRDTLYVTPLELT